MSTLAIATIADGDESTTTNAGEIDLTDLIEQHAGGPPQCTAPSCYSTDRLAWVEADDGDGDPRPVCGECRERHGVGR